MRVGELGLDAAIAVGAWMSLAMAVATFFAAPVLGNLSDAWGRRPVLLIALGGMAANYALLTLADSLALIVLARVLTGPFEESNAPAQAAVAGVTLPDQRANEGAQGEAQGLASMMMGLGSILGPLVLVGPMAWFTGPEAPVYFPGAPYLIAALIALGALGLVREVARS